MKQVFTRLFFCLALVSGSSDYSEDFLCYEVIQSNSAVEELYSKDLDDKACEIETAVADKFGEIEVLGCDFHTVLAYAKTEEITYFEKLFNKAVVDIRSTKGAFILFSKEYHKGAEITIRTAIDFPEILPFTTMDAITKEAVHARVQKAIDDVLNLDRKKSIPAELAGMEVFKQIILNGFSGNAFDESGFNVVEIEDVSIFTRTGISTNGQSVGITTTYDDQGYQVSGESMAALLSAAGYESNSSATINFAYYLTGKEDFEDPVFVNQITIDFNNNKAAKIKTWIHFDFETINVNDPNALKEDDLSKGSKSQKQKIYIKTDNNLTDLEAEALIDEDFEKDYGKNTGIGDEDLAQLDDPDCSPTWQFGKNCIYPTIRSNTDNLGFAGDYLSANGAFIAGALDGLLGTIEFIIFGTDFVYKQLQSNGKKIFFWMLDKAHLVFSPGTYYARKLWSNRTVLAEAMKRHIQSFRSDHKQYLEDLANSGKKLWGDFTDGTKKTWDKIKDLASEVKDELVHQFTDTFQSSITDSVAYIAGVIAFEVVLTVLTSGAYAGAKASISAAKRGSSIVKAFGEAMVDAVKTTAKSSAENTASILQKQFGKASNNLSNFKCFILRNGCFVEDTPILMASKNYWNQGKTLALAASMPIVAVPIQEVRLLDYAVAHETVNAGYGVTASANEDDTYLGLLDKDPYTSDQQRARDEYEINNTDWNEVVFEQVYGSSTAKLALHQDWINDKGYHVNGVVELNLPEQGINGPFRITSIKHILPRKKPVDDDESDSYNYRPVTALFTHESNQVYEISFDNGEELGVTYQHPIYSVTAGDWRLAGELEIGEKVLTKSGDFTVTNTAKKEGPETVYNLEVQELHNFLVSDIGIVVHNNYYDEVRAFLTNLSKEGRQKIIDDAWASGFPRWFKRGRFIEELLGQTRFKEWTWTGSISSTFPVVDYARELAGKFVAASVKTTKTVNVGDWISANRVHLNKLRDGKFFGEFVQGSGASANRVPADLVELHIYVPKANYSAGMEATWKAAIKTDYPDIDIFISTVENQVGL